MEKVYICALITSILCHQTNLFYNPIEATKESTVFIYLILMAFLKIHCQSWDYDRHCGDVREKIMQFLTLCVTVQVLLLIAWFPLSIIVHHFVNMAWHHGPGERDWLVKLIQDNSASFILLALEFCALFMGFEMIDILRFFLSRDDLLSESALSIVIEQRERVLSWKKQNQRKRRRRSKDKDNHILKKIESR
nr:uncharacterized protein LOC108125783 [Drosophila bipectinata]